MRTGVSNRSFRASGFGFLSDLGFRVSDFGMNALLAEIGTPETEVLQSRWPSLKTTRQREQVDSGQRTPGSRVINSAT